MAARTSAVVSLLVLLVPCSARAATYYVAPTGNDGGAGTVGAPFRTLAKGASVLAPGDKLLARAGTYAEEFYNAIPGGTSWSQPVTIAAYPGEKPVIKPPAGAARVFTFSAASVRYVVVEGFALDATNTQYDAIKVTWGSSDGASHHIRIKSCEVFGSPGQGILVTGESGKNGLDVTGNEFIDLDVHDNGKTDFDHGFYVSTAGNLIEGCRVHKNAGWGIHVYNEANDDADNNVIRNNRSYDNAAAGARGVGIGIYSGTGTLAYNNLIWGNKIGIQLDYGATDAGVFNNVVYGNVDFGVYVGDGATGSRVKNNAVWQNDIGVADNGAGSTLDKNLIDADPAVIDAPNHDFRPTPQSPLVDKGGAVAEVTADIDGVPRPQGAAYDIGAYELCVGSACKGDAGPTDDASAGDASAGGDGGSGAGGAAGDGGPGGSAASGGPGDSGGCGCRAARSASGAFSLIVAALAGAVFLRPRRRRRRG